ncbi:MAG: LacI family DNA-binding transcriptional regulator [Lachnospiraceae bacterium]
MNISEIAELAGVSKSTVSRVLSKNGSVSVKSKEKVLKAIQDSNYRPNPYARILNKKSTNLLGVIVPDIANPYFPQMIQEIEHEANIRNYKIILCISGTTAESEFEYLDMLENMCVDGTILLCPTAHITDLSAYERQSIISVDAVINENIPSICSDFYKGGYLAASKLLENNCKNILHISGHNYFYANIKRRQGFEAAISTAMDSINKYDLLSDLSMSKGFKIIREYFAAHPNVDGVFADNDSIAFMVLRILNELHIRVPDQIKVIGYDDNFMIPMVYPALSTIHQPISEVGRLAAITVINMINRQKVNHVNILDVAYIKRETTLL